MSPTLISSELKKAEKFSKGRSVNEEKETAESNEEK